MATESWQKNAAVNRLLRNPERFNFHQAIKVVEYAIDKSGTSLENVSEKIRFTVNPSRSFQSTQLSSCTIRTDAITKTSYIELGVNFLGLVGAAGILPQHYNVDLLRQLKKRQNAVKMFYDIFHQRIIRQYHDAWAKQRVLAQFDDAKRKVTHSKDVFKFILSAYFGHATDHMSDRLLFSDNFLLSFSGIIANQRRSALSLETVIAECIKVKAQIESYVPKWLYLSPDDVSVLTSKPDVGAFNLLGENLILGQRVHDVQSNFLINLGPLDYMKFLTLLPGGKLFGKLVQLVRYLVGVELNFDIKLTLKASDVPLCQLGGQNPLMLGYNTWLQSKSFQNDVDDVVISPI